MKKKLTVLMALLVAGVLCSQNTRGQDLSRFAKMTIEPSSVWHQAERGKAPQALLSIKERLKRGQEMLWQDLPVSNLDRFRASIDVSLPIEHDGEREMLNLATTHFGYGNFRTATTTVDLWRWPVTKRNYLTFTGIFIDPGLHDNVWGGIVWRYSIGRQGRK